MRLIADQPRFTWNGTLFIIGGFTVFGCAQSVVAGARRRSPPRWKLTIVRVGGALAMAPLFVAAGALMFPTVAGCGLAIARTDWRRITRVASLVVATGPVAYVAHDLLEKFGWSLRAVAGLGTMIAIYSVIIATTRFTFSPQQDGWHLSRPAKLTTATITVATIGGLLLIGGIE